MEHAKTIQLADYERQGKLLVPLYELIAEKCGFDPDSTYFNCTRIEISADIQEGLYAAYRIKYAAEYADNPSDFDTQVTMLLARSGPKADRGLRPGQVRIYDGFFQEDSGIPPSEQNDRED